MRIDTCLIALSSCLGLSLSACGKKAEKPGPEPATAQVSKPEPVAPPKPTTPSKPDPDRTPPSPADRRGPADRAEAMQATLGLMENGDFREAFKYLADDIVWTEVGLPDGELDSVEKVVKYQQQSRTGYSDFRIKAKRIIAAADYQVVELVWSARHSGAFADGTPATDKVVTLPGAMLVRYQKDGLIDRVWVFQDWPNALQQLGLAKDLPTDFKPFPLPERTDIVAGPDDALFRERYEGFVSKLGPNDYRATLADRADDDFAWIDFGSGRLLNGRDAASAFLAQGVQSFEAESTTIEASIGAGSYFAAYVTTKLVYKGGFMGVAANKQEITTHTLDIVQFDASKLRLKTLARYGNSYEILAALQLTAGTASRPEAKVGRFTIDACNDYVANMRVCIESQDGVKQQAMRDALDQQIVRWQSDTRTGDPGDQVKRSCQGAIALAKDSLAASCPRVTWN